MALVKSAEGEDSVGVVEFYARTRVDTDDGEVKRLLDDLLNAFGVAAHWVDVADAQALRSRQQGEAQPPSTEASRAQPPVSPTPAWQEADGTTEEDVADHPEAEPT